MGQKRILIVDDEECILSVLKGSLKALGEDCQVVTASCGREALDQARRGSIDLMVTDYRMPEMDGLQLVAAMRAIQPRVQVVMMTAYASAELEHQARRMQVYRYLTKPLEIAAFRQVVRDALGSSLAGAVVSSACSEADYAQIQRCLERLQVDTGAQCAFLSDAAGRVIARAGGLDEAWVGVVLPLLRGIAAAAEEARRALRSRYERTHLVYLEGETQDLAALNVGQHLLLVLLFERSVAGERLGGLWYYARYSAYRLRHLLEEPS